MKRKNRQKLFAGLIASVMLFVLHGSILASGVSGKTGKTEVLSVIVQQNPAQGAPGHKEQQAPNPNRDFVKAKDVPPADDPGELDDKYEKKQEQGKLDDQHEKELEHGKLNHRHEKKHGGKGKGKAPAKWKKKVEHEGDEHEWEDEHEWDDD